MEEHKTIEVQSSEVKTQNVELQTKSTSKIVAALFYILGIALIGVAIYYLSNDLRPEYSFEKHYYFKAREYVGGDAYNYIISAARSTAIMVKSLIYAVLGCTSMIMGRLCH